MGRDVFAPFVPATVCLGEKQMTCVPGIVIRQEEPGVQNTEIIMFCLEKLSVESWQCRRGLWQLGVDEHSLKQTQHQS